MTRKRRSKGEDKRLINNEEKDDNDINQELELEKTQSSSKKRKSSTSSKNVKEIENSPKLIEVNKNKGREKQKDVTPKGKPADKNNNASVSASKRNYKKEDKAMPSNSKQTKHPNQTTPKSTKIPSTSGKRKLVIETEDEMEFEGDYEDIEDEEIVPVEYSQKSPENQQLPKRKKGETVEMPNAEAFQQIMRELAEVKKQLNQRTETQNKGIIDEKTETATKTVEKTGKSRKEPEFSPSNETIYMPAVRKADDTEYRNLVNKLKIHSISPIVENRKRTISNPTNNDNVNIDQFLTGIRDEVSSSDEEPFNKRMPPRRLEFRESSDEERQDPMVNVRTQAKDRILAAEKHRAQVEAPKGMGIDRSVEILDDDELMHVAYSTDESVNDKVEQGKFIEMDKLYNKSEDFAEGSEDGKMVLVNKGGWTAWEPATKRQKITNVFQWEKAFRVYMAIYTKANPTKSSEMIQYLHTIHHAASKYAWNNVAYYDRVFRKWMEKNPNRSWGKTLNQMWNICLTDPIGRGSYSNQQSNGKKEGRSTCWKFNKGHCSYPNCKFIHKCTYCGGTSHGAATCFKKGSGRKSEQQTTGRQNGSSRNNQNGQGNGSAAHPVQESQTSSNHQQKPRNT